VSAQRVAFLVDGDAYFRALAAALERARRSVWIVGWDVHARTRLRGSREGEEPLELGALLTACARRQRRLRVRILEWDYALWMAPERGLAPWLDLDWAAHRRIRFRLDDRHPVGACHHQKLVVIDDALAFAGGIDVTLRRWDTPDHRPGDERRVDAWGRAYPPWHDVQLVVDGPAARALAELARQRWRRATGARWSPMTGARVSRAPRFDPWPPELAPDLHDVPVAILRTDPGSSDRPAVREVERHYLASIAAARTSLYIENQYLTSEAVTAALCRRLEERDGPEVVIVLPSRCSGWLEEKTIGALRVRNVARLRAADRAGRLRLCAPCIPGVERLLVHSKLLIADDALIRIGSANLSNRSMGVDSECDLSIEAEGRADVAAAIARLRAALLAEHLGVTPEAVERARTRAGGSLVGALDALAGGPRTLVALEQVADSESASLAGAAFDPIEPMAALSELIERWAPSELSDPHRRTLAVAVPPLLLLGVLGLAVYALQPQEALAQAWAAARASAWLGPAALAWFVLGSLLLVPLTLLVASVVLALGAGQGALWASVGALSSALAGWLLGRFVLRGLVIRVAGPRITALRRDLPRRGALAVAAARVLPLAPHGVVNLVSGAARVPLATYCAGSALTLLPGVALLSVLAHAAARAVREPGLGSFAVLAVCTALAWGSLLALRAWLGPRVRGAGTL
jgi:phosphatidylserine/phosphatidylglycerophosphate/cardiolipin synthase-like enzyme/uncharacterized membrane protein YdjX (TVP38/TMEM64 family)